jgi:phosphoglycolate phosphatase
MHLLLALERLTTPAGTALMVGDHPLDIQTGKRAGTLTAGVTSGNSSEADLSKSGADWTARNCEELVDLLTREGKL